MSELLEPCPFCGGEAEELYLEDEDNFGGSVISCKKCGASSPVHFDRKTNLHSSWNDRARPSPVSCPRCGEMERALEWAFALADTYDHYGRGAVGRDASPDFITKLNALSVAVARARAARTGKDAT
jgi:Lar family restriction alleviation protein